MNEAENRQKLYNYENMQKTKQDIIFCLWVNLGLCRLHIQRVRPAMDVNTMETCQLVLVRYNQILILFTESLESKIDYLVNKLKG